ncbi:MAG: galactokinase [Chloroflexi bacterium]|nr:galactokinase [Chloroflexota bacterium]
MSLLKTVSLAFIEHFHEKPRLVVRAPGRVNLIGEHTDYNEGFVLPMAIDRAVWIALQPRPDRQVLLHSLDFNESVSFSLDGLEKEGESWVEYIKGAAWAMQQAGFEPRGWEGVIAGDIPIGAGLSSSAAIQLAALRAFSEISRIRWDEVTAAELALKAEQEWIGLKCGIMDQMVSAAARQGHAMFLDCRDLRRDHIHIPSYLGVVALDTGTRRGLVGSAYNTRQVECEEAARHFNVRSLREVSPEMLAAQSAGLDGKLLRRARHVVSENRRVVEAVTALLGAELDRLGELVNESHASLRDDFEVSSEALDRMVGIAVGQPGCYGARLTGAGFGGCAVALVDGRRLAQFHAAVAAHYRQETGLEPGVYICRPSQGTSREAPGLRLAEFIRSGLKRGK